MALDCSSLTLTTAEIGTAAKSVALHLLVTESLLSYLAFLDVANILPALEVRVPSEALQRRKASVPDNKDASDTDDDNDNDEEDEDDVPDEAADDDDDVSAGEGANDDDDDEEEEDEGDSDAEEEVDEVDSDEEDIPQPPAKKRK